MTGKGWFELRVIVSERSFLEGEGEGEETETRAETLDGGETPVTQPG